MYTPKSFEQNNKKVIYEFINENSFATLITSINNEIEISHLNLIIADKDNDDLILLGHLARANPQIKHIQNNAHTNAIAIFTGPHAYISPAWYETQPAVPTWNYTAVHAHGKIEPITDITEFKKLLDKLVNKYESQREKPWSFSWDSDYHQTQLKGILGFKLKVDRLEGKFKLNQNHPIANQLGVIRGLENSTNPTDRAIAELMKKNI